MPDVMNYIQPPAGYLETKANDDRAGIIKQPEPRWSDP